jgi:hypothetical protein
MRGQEDAECRAGLVKERSRHAAATGTTDFLSLRYLSQLDAVEHHWVDGGLDLPHGLSSPFEEFLTPGAPFLRLSLQGPC